MNFFAFTGFVFWLCAAILLFFVAIGKIQIGVTEEIVKQERDDD
jgi:hypothetical protein